MLRKGFGSADYVQRDREILYIVTQSADPSPFRGTVGRLPWWGPQRVDYLDEGHTGYITLMRATTGRLPWWGPQRVYYLDEGHNGHQKPHHRHSKRFLKSENKYIYQYSILYKYWIINSFIIGSPPKNLHNAHFIKPCGSLINIYNLDLVKVLWNGL